MGDDSTRFPTFWTEDGTQRATYTLTRAPGTKPGNFTLRERFLYTDPLTPDEGIVVPAQPGVFTTDLASIPAPFTWLVPKDGTHTPAALLHDALVSDPMLPADYRLAHRDPESGLWHTDDADPEPRCEREDADNIFRHAMAHLGVSFIRRWMVWATVTAATLCSQPGSKKWRWRLLFLVAVLALGVGGVLEFLDLIDVQGQIHLPVVCWHFDWQLPWMGEHSAGAELRGAAAAHLVATAALTVACGRRWRVGLIFGLALSALAVPLFVSSVAYLAYQAVELLAYGILQLAPKARRAVHKEPSPTPVNAPPTIERFQ